MSSDKKGAISGQRRLPMKQPVRIASIEAMCYGRDQGQTDLPAFPAVVVSHFVGSTGLWYHPDNFGKAVPQMISHWEQKAMKHPDPSPKSLLLCARALRSSSPGPPTWDGPAFKDGLRTRPSIRKAFLRVVVGLVCVTLLAGLPRCNPVPDPQPGELGRWVDPFIGTGGIPWASGMLFPGATLPFGMVRLCPDTTHIHGMLIDHFSTSGYSYSHRHITGFSHTRLSGTGATDGGHVRITPVAGTPEPAERLTRPIYFSHDHEAAAPGYYAVWLMENKVLAELTSTIHVGVHRYTFRPRDEAHLLVDATSYLGHGRAEDGWIEVTPEAQEVVGTGRVFGSFSGRYDGLQCYFVARANAPFTGFGTWLDGVLEEGRLEVEGDDVGADLRFDTGSDETVVEVKVALSFVSLANARANLEA